ncbi:serine/threonine-protein kinase [Tengunoibacter tsumagoiensis]|uniref:Protein kinase domain-containing protein n=1 Tax=Tengunoibacter tsumagoiensis TaxID=2014871 RepID=A0A402AA73_9CHLR|nr:serine/threonine-protein kinase [Tengunoibacter tsumagoiensis]GCE15936.1 hypothetical protein KTT_57950 [Tengunoibacter tsumagoiensis]
MNTVTHEIPFSFEQPEQMLNALLKLLQQRLNQHAASPTFQKMQIRQALTVLIIDKQQHRGHYIENLLLTTGYRPVTVVDALDAFTLYLQGSLIPFAIILGQEDDSKRFFLLRLLQQVMQKYEWEAPIIRLTSGQSQPSTQTGIGGPLLTQNTTFPAPPQASTRAFQTGSSFLQQDPGRSSQLPSFAQPAPGRPSNTDPFNPTIQQPSSRPSDTDLFHSPMQSVSGKSSSTGPLTPEAIPFPDYVSAPPLPNAFSDAFSGTPSRADENSFGTFTFPNPLQQKKDSSVTPRTNTVPLSGEKNTLATTPTQPLPILTTPNTSTGPFVWNPPPPSHVTRSVPDSTIQQVPFPEQRIPPTTTRKLPPPQEQKKREKVSLVGQSLGRYQIDALIGGSTYSNVYTIYDRLREQTCAIKAVQTDFLSIDTLELQFDELNIFEQEAEILDKLKHPHIFPILNHGKSYVSGSPFIYKTMPYCAERSLKHWITHHGGIRNFHARQLVPLIVQLADAIQYAHEHHVLYQNFKMSNILVLHNESQIENLQVAIADFAGQDGSFVANSSDAYLYVAPERWEGQVQPASDQYGLAAIAYELFTGRPPFQGNAERIVKQMHLTMQPQAPSVFNPQLPPAVNNVLLCALAKRPHDRFASVAIFAQTLQHSFGLMR